MSRSLTSTPMLALVAAVTISSCSTSASGPPGGTSGSQSEPAATQAHSGGASHENSTSPSRARLKYPPIVKKCEEHSLEKPAPIGTPLCSRLAVLEVRKVYWDTGSSRIGRGWKYRVSKGETFLSIDFRITSLTIPTISTSQMVPSLTDVNGTIAKASGSYDVKDVPRHGSVSFRADYSVDPDQKVALKDLVVCNAYLSSPEASKGCGLLTKG